MTGGQAVGTHAVDGLRVYLDEIGRSEPPGLAETAFLIARVREGHADALRELILAHLFLVAEVVDERIGDPADAPAALEVGNAALVEAVAAFDAAGGEGFREYAADCVRRALDRALAA
jgi:DNA-directed RNA polymerase sigma subunit (sigma70/sigma32)